MAGILFEDIFDVKDIDPEGKKFDRGKRCRGGRREVANMPTHPKWLARPTLSVPPSGNSFFFFFVNEKLETAFSIIFAVPGARWVALSWVLAYPWEPF